MVNPQYRTVNDFFRNAKYNPTMEAIREETRRENDRPIALGEALREHQMDINIRTIPGFQVI